MSVRLRPRNPFEALDLGIALVRSNFRAVYTAWLAIFVPTAVIAHLVFLNDAFWAWLALWWLKPAFDRAILAVLAPAIFGEERGAKAFLAEPSRAFRRTGLFPALTWRRFDLARSFHLPVHQLERITGKPMRARLRVLDRDSRGAAVWLTFLLANLEGILLIAISLLVALLLPVQTPIDTILEAWSRRAFAPGEAGGFAGSVIGALALSLVEPFYVGCGFTLYLQRRTHLEGWDIELRFRQLAARVSGAAAIVFMAIAITFAIPPSASFAADAPATQAKREARDILKDPIFGTQEPVRTLKYVGPRWKGDDKPTQWDWNWVKTLAEFLAASTRALAWIGAIAVIACALYYLAKYVRGRGLARARGPRPDFLFGLDVRPGSLPDDVGAAAESLAREGSARAALSLLYRGALVRFMDEGIEFLQGDTEGDCVRRVEAFASKGRRHCFMKLVLAWQSLAYAHQAIDSAAVLALAHDWRAHFDSRRLDGGGAPHPQPA